MKLNHQKIKELRKATGLSQADFAADAGIRKGTYLDIEQGNTDRPSDETLAKLAKALEVKVADLFFLDPADVPTVPMSAPRGRPKSKERTAKCGGWIECGQPVPRSDAALPERIPLAEIYNDDDDYIWYCVSGRSMTAHKIQNRDWVAIVPETDFSKVKPGDLIAVIIDGGIVLKEHGTDTDGSVILKSRSHDSRHKNLKPTDGEPGQLVGIYSHRSPAKKRTPRPKPAK